MTCSRTQPPARILVLESEKLHLRFGTTPLSVLWAPRLSGFCRSICLFVPPEKLVKQRNFQCHEPRTEYRSPFAFVIYGLSLGELLPLVEPGSGSSGSTEKTQGAKLHIELPAEKLRNNSWRHLLTSSMTLYPQPPPMRARSPYLRAGIKARTI